MSLQSDLIQYLIGLNTGAAGRVHDQEVPQGVPLPFVAMNDLGGSQPRTLGGRKLFARKTIQLAIFGRSAADRDSISSAIRTAIDQFTLTNPKGGMIGDTRVISVRASSSADEVAFKDGDNVIKGGAVDLSFMYQE